MSSFFEVVVGLRGLFGVYLILGPTCDRFEVGNRICIQSLFELRVLFVSGLK